MNGDLGGVASDVMCGTRRGSVQQREYKCRPLKHYENNPGSGIEAIDFDFSLALH